MTLRIRIPPLLDVVLVSDANEMARLNADPAVDRRYTGAGGLVHRLVCRRITHTLAVGAQALPALSPRGEDARASQQRQTERRLSKLATAKQPFDPDDVATLGRYVAGADTGPPVGVAAQQVIGRLFRPTYAASRDSYAAARVVASLLNPRPMTAVRSVWWTWSGRVAASRELLWTLAEEDRQCIHATSLAVHGVVEILERMRRAARDPRGLGREPAAEVVARCIAAPSAVMRASSAPSRPGFLRSPLRMGTLVVFRLARMYEGSRDPAHAFSEGQWSYCPAHRIVPRLLEEVWTEAVHAHATLRYARRRRSWPSTAFRRGFAVLNRFVPWYGIPAWVPLRTWIEAANLVALRGDLREQNLHDTRALPPSTEAPLPPRPPEALHWRTADGSFNDLEDPAMGRAGTRFGRNVPLAATVPEDLPGEPDPRLISRRLLTREAFVPSPLLNVLAAAWIQFQVHDWFDHGDAVAESPIRIDLQAGDDWPGRRPMLVGRTRRDRTDDPPAFVNRVTHWWDASQLYGSDQGTQWLVRSGSDGKLALENGRLPFDPKTDLEVTGFNRNWWVGLSLLHHLFTLEHNAICDRLRQTYRTWTDEPLFQTARLVNAALIAKIHSLEWTTAVLAHPTLKLVMGGNWWGLAGEWIRKHVGRLGDSDVISGILGSPTDHHGAPYAMTEEFVAIYRMHPLLMPDELTLRRLSRDGGGERVPFDAVIGGGHSRSVFERFSMPDVCYSLGLERAGHLTLGNYPRTLQALSMGGAPLIDVATVDLVRDRERGVPRYNELRRRLRMKPIRSFDQLNPLWADRLREVYGTEAGRDRVERLDLMIGLFAETPPPGFGFSDTAFRLFVLMASRRLKSDRFFTTDYTPAVYTRVGLDWIDDNDMKSVLLRHWPALAPAILDAPNVFAPWRSLA